MTATTPDSEGIKTILEGIPEDEHLAVIGAGHCSQVITLVIRDILRRNGITPPSREEAVGAYDDDIRMIMASALVCGSTYLLGAITASQDELLASPAVILAGHLQPNDARLLKSVLNRDRSVGKTATQVTLSNSREMLAEYCQTRGLDEMGEPPA